MKVSQLLTLRSRIVRIGGPAVALLGALAAAATFLPRVSISPRDPVDPTNPFSASFTVTNTGLVPLNDVGVRIALGEIIAEPLPFNPPKRFELGSGGFDRIGWLHHTLEIDEPYTVPVSMFGLGKGERLSGADLAIVIRYKPWFLPWHRDKAFRFQTYRQSNGGLYWYSVPME